MNLNERDFSNTVCNRFLAETDKRGVVLVAFLSALRTKSSAVAPSKTGMLLIVIAIIKKKFMQMYYFIVTRQMMLFGDGGIFPEDEDEHDRDE